MSKHDIEQLDMKLGALVMPLRDVVVFPGTVMPLFVGREKSIEAIQAAMQGDRQIFLVSQKNPEQDSPRYEDVYHVGTLATILQTLKLADGTVKVLIEGMERFELLNLQEDEHVFRGDIRRLYSSVDDEAELQQLMKLAKERFAHYAKLNSKLSSDVRGSVERAEEPDVLVDLVAANLDLTLEAKQQLLETSSLNKRVEKLIALVETQIDLIEAEKRIAERVKKQMDRNQREYYLNEKIKAIHKELGRSDGEEDEYVDLKTKIEAAGMPDEVKEKALSELNKLRMMPPQSAEAAVVRNYIEWLLDVPWKKRTRVSKDIKRAAKILDAHHYGLEKVKERILEYLAVQKRVRKLNGPILCLVGPPGVGKTSLARSIAEATNRKFVRMSLGGVRDEAEIRGHRRTYLGALPGRIIQKMVKAGVKNPLFLLDEIDKMSADFRGDPAAALLEVLDPEQNSTFNDHYLEVDYDLSEVMFVATSNSMDMPEPLLDRMEIIQLSGYTELEKKHIAMQHLLPRQLRNHGLKADELQITEAAIEAIIRGYTREAGVRSLERELAKIARKVVKALEEGEKQAPVVVEPEHLEAYLGVARYRHGEKMQQNRVGLVNGLAWTRVGGDLLHVEATCMPGKGRIKRTGQLGDVMQESVETAVSVIRSRTAQLGLQPDFYEKVDLHLHFPEGAIKKDGPSAGIAIATAIASVLTNIPVRNDVAMTGEITLRGEVLPIGGLKEKLLAALRADIRKVLIPHDNVRDLAEIPDEIKGELEIVPVRWVDEVFEHALERLPKPVDNAEAFSCLVTAEPAVSASESAH
ncbi:ATP-dependent proteinase. Serine peptidase. MEROPS family S16 [Sulfurivirga caldicuralii]|uniref:Lon protease n=1 Tax=Sulfurivirga caldicuralii TaxID=364032 RepID=A0A1N6E1M2_9GAMM|nr:endopeptidase La [Sulfurivirga caldicuralii]SIN76930.1 ATP-dependent proteinase. Serine peptidase. MEROPS family S16 [Sulfurivirga caldicuralii]